MAVCTSCQDGIEREKNTLGEARGEVDTGSECMPSRRRVRIIAVDLQSVSM